MPNSGAEQAVKPFAQRAVDFQPPRAHLRCALHRSGDSPGVCSGSGKSML